LEIGRVKGLAREIDKDSFIVVQSLAEAEGGVLKRAALH
jgi:hypothetical protein